MATQREICDYLVRNKREDIHNKEQANAIFRQHRVGAIFIIGHEIQHMPTDSARYFEIYFEETLANQYSTPEVFQRKCLLKIDQEGNISLTNNQFNLYHANQRFYFDQDKLQMEEVPEDEAMAAATKTENKARQHPDCMEQVLSFGFFACLAGVTAYSTLNYFTPSPDKRP